MFAIVIFVKNKIAQMAANPLARFECRLMLSVFYRMYPITVVFHVKIKINSYIYSSYTYTYTYLWAFAGK